MKQSHNILELKEFAASQWGMFTNAQAQQLDVRRNQISRMVDAGKAEPVSYGVYRLTSGDETTSSDVKAAWLSVYPKESARTRLNKRPYDAVVAGRTAAFMHGFGDYYASPYTFIVSQRKQTTRRNMRYLERNVEPRDIVFIDGLPVTSIERTVADLVASHDDPDLVGSFMADASREGGHIFDRDRLIALLAPFARRNGYRANDGESFATDLIKRYVANIQVADAAGALERALSSAYGSGAMQQLQEQMQLIAEQYVSSNAFKKLQAAMQQQTASASRAVTQMAFALEEESMQAIKKAAEAMMTMYAASIAAVLPTDKWSQLVGQAMPSTTRKGALNREDVSSTAQRNTADG